MLVVYDGRREDLQAQVLNSLYERIGDDLRGIGIDKNPSISYRDKTEDSKRWSSKATWMRPGCSRDSICWVLLLWGRFAAPQTIIPESQEHFLTPSARRDTHPFGGLGLTNAC